MQLVICGNPGSVADPHVPWKTEDDEVEPPEEEEDGPEDGEEGDEPTSVPPDAAAVALGAVGDNNSALFWNWQPVTRIELTRRRSRREPLLIPIPYGLVCAHTIIVSAENWIVAKNQLKRVNYLQQCRILAIAA